MNRVLTLLAIFILLSGCITVKTQEKGSSLPAVKGIWEIRTDSSGNVWFVEIITNKIGKLDTKKGTVDTYDLPAGVRPRGLAIDGRGVVWTTTSEPGGVLRFDPITKETTLFMLPQGNQFVSSIAVDQEDGVWFTVSVPGRIGRLEREGSTIHLYDIPSTPSLPEDLIIDKRGVVWFTEQGTHQLGSFDPTTGRFEEHPIPLKTAMPGRMALDEEGAIWFIGGPMGEFWFRFDPGEKKFIVESTGDQDLKDVAAGPAGDIWLTDSESGALKRLNSRTGEVEVFPIPTKGGGPSGLTIDQKGDIYFVEYRHNKIAKFLVGSRTFVEFDIP